MRSRPQRVVAAGLWPALSLRSTPHVFENGRFLSRLPASVHKVAGVRQSVARPPVTYPF